MTKELFDNAAPNWDTNPIRLQLAAQVSAALRHALPLASDMTAFEIGCGTGLITTALAPYLKKIIAADSSAGMLQVLREKIKGQKIINIEPLEIDFSADNSFPASQPFNLVYSNMTLHHISDVEAVLKKCRQILTHDGFLAMADLEKEDGSFHSDMGGVQHLGFIPEELAEMTRKCGFTDVNTQRVHVITKENSRKQIRDYPVFLLTARNY